MWNILVSYWMLSFMRAFLNNYMKYIYMLTSTNAYLAWYLSYADTIMSGGFSYDEVSVIQLYMSTGFVWILT